MIGDQFTRLLQQQREANRPVGGSDVASVLIGEERDQFLLDVLQWNKAYDEKADARAMAWLTDPFHDAVVWLFTPAHQRPPEPPVYAS